MDTEQYCKQLHALDPVDAIRAIHEAYLQLKAMSDSKGRVCVDGQTYDNKPALRSLRKCLQDAGHIGFDKEESQ